MRPNPAATSSTLYPNAPATGATYLKDSPSIATFVLELEDAAASTSEKCAESLALSPKAVSASVTISETIARSSPDAAAKFMIPDIPCVMSAVFQPAIAMYSSALPASVALNTVLIPISLAFSLRISSCASLDPLIACTVFICASKLDPITVAAPASPAVTLATTLPIVFIRFSNFDRPPSILLIACLVALPKEASTLPPIFILISYSFLLAKFTHLLNNFYKLPHRHIHKIFHACIKLY